jgi:hypothetical protein
MGVGNDVTIKEVEIPYPKIGHKVQGHASSSLDIRVVCNLDLDFFRLQLVEHFDILYNQIKIVWLSQTGISGPKPVEVPANWY